MMNILWILSITLNSYICVATLSILPPDQVVSVPGGNAAFTCLLLTSPTDVITEVQWLLNNAEVESHGLANVEIGFSPIGQGFGSLRFGSIPIEFNNTRIRCQAELLSGRTEISLETELVLVEGFLAAVQSLLVTEVDSYISITWNAPPSLNIDGINSNHVHYCVEIVDLSASESLLNQCDVEETEFNYFVPASAVCHDIRVVVTPVNFVGSGASEDFVYYSAEASPRVVDQVRISSISGDTLFTLMMSAVVCSAELTLKDRDDTNNMVILRSSNLYIEGSNITLNSSSLMPNRFYNVRCNASNARGSETSDSSLCTHDLNHFTVTRGILETGFFEPSDAIGAMIGFVFMDGSGDIDFNRSLFRPFSRGGSHNVTLDRGNYVVHGYDIERNGMLYNSVGHPAVSLNLTIRENTRLLSQQLSHEINDCHISATSVNITVKCTSLNSVVTGFQAVAQLGRTNEVCKLYVNQSTDLQTSITITVETDGLYRVTVFAIGSVNGIMGIMFNSLPFTDTVLIDQGTPGSGTNNQSVVIPLMVVILVVILVVVILLVAIITVAAIWKKNQVEPNLKVKVSRQEDKALNEGYRYEVEPSVANFPESDLESGDSRSEGHLPFTGFAGDGNTESVELDAGYGEVQYEDQ